MVFTPSDGRAGIDSALVGRLIDAQFPQWSGLPVTPVEVDGNDNRTYRLGEDMTVRLPTTAGYVPAVAKENDWLPRLAPALPLAVPRILAKGRPGQEYPFPWSVRGWLPGRTADRGRIDDLSQFAISLAEFIRALQRCDTAGGPLAGEHSWFRGALPAHYDEETRRYLAALTGRNVTNRSVAGDGVTIRVDTARAAAVWDAALTAEWQGPPVWFHGDIASGNLLVHDGRLSAVIDFGTSGVGDPACDLVIAWTMLSGDSREAFRLAVGQDEGTWARARGWALWKALLLVAQYIDTDLEQVALNQHIIDEVLADHDQYGCAEPRVLTA